MMEEGNKTTKTCGDHLESLGRMTFPITGKEKIDRPLTKVIVLGLLAGIAIPAMGNLVDVGQLILSGVGSVVGLISSGG